MLGGPNSIQTPDHPNSLTVFRYIVVRAFQKDAVATGLPDWSKMNADLYNLHVWYPGGVLWLVNDGDDRMEAKLRTQKNP